MKVVDDLDLHFFFNLNKNIINLKLQDHLQHYSHNDQIYHFINLFNFLEDEADEKDIN